MAAINYKELKKMSEGLKPSVFNKRMQEGFDDGAFRPSDFSIQRLAEECFGREFVEACNPKDPDTMKLARIKEAGDGVDSTSFSNITGQIVYNAILQKYNSPARIATNLVPTIQTELSGEKIAGMQSLADQGDNLIVGEGDPYPHYAFGEDYIETPETVKRGEIVNVTLEAVFFDRTNEVLRAAQNVGEAMAINKEKRIMDLILGVTNNYKQVGTAYDTFRTTDSADGILPANYLTDNELIDYTNIDAVQQLFNGMTDPYTGEPILIEAMTILCAQAKQTQLWQALNSTETQYNSTGTGTIRTVSNAPTNLTAYTPVTSPYVQHRLVASGKSTDVANKTWITGDFSKAYAYMENWGITTSQKGTDSALAFNQDIVHQFKVSERGAAAVMNPRYVVKSDNSTAS